MNTYEYNEKQLITDSNVAAPTDYTVEIPEGAIAVQTRKKSLPLAGDTITVSWLQPTEGRDDA